MANEWRSVCGLVRLGDPIASTHRADHQPGAPRAQRRAVRVQEDGPSAVAARGKDRPRDGEVAAQGTRGRRAEQELALLVALAGDAQPAPLEVDAIDGEAGELADAHAGRVEQLEHRLVAPRQRLVAARQAPRRGDELLGLVDREDARQP